MRLFPLRRAAVQSMCAAEGVRPSPRRPHSLTPRRAPPSPTISHRRIHRRAFCPHVRPPPVSCAFRSSRAFRAALPPRFTLPQLVPPPFAFPSFLNFALRRALPRSSPRRSTRFAPCVSPSCNSPQISAPATRSLSSRPASRFSFFFSLLPSRARQSRPHHVSQTPRPGSQPPAGRRLPASPPDLSLQKSLLFHASPPLFEHD